MKEINKDNVIFPENYRGMFNHGFISRRFREPFLSLSHFFGVFFGLIFFASFVPHCHLDSKQTISLVIYGFSFLTLFLASGLLHGKFHKTIAEEDFYERLDYIGIFFFIAGTYTPIALETLSHSLATWVLTIQWTVAIIGAFVIINYGIHAKGILTVLFLIMGWMFLAVSPSIFSILSGKDFCLLLIGTLLYSFGAAIFALAPKRIWNDRICTHAIWHIFVLGGAMSHLVLIGYILKIMN